VVDKFHQLELPVSSLGVSDILERSRQFLDGNIDSRAGVVRGTKTKEIGYEHSINLLDILDVAPLTAHFHKTELHELSELTKRYLVLLTQWALSSGIA